MIQFVRDLEVYLLSLGYTCFLFYECNQYTGISYYNLSISGNKLSIAFPVAGKVENSLIIHGVEMKTINLINLSDIYDLILKHLLTTKKSKKEYWLIIFNA